MNAEEQFAFLKRFITFLIERQITDVCDADIYAFLEYNR